MATTARLVTADELLEMPDDGKTFYELVRGELRPMSPSGGPHSALALRLAIELGAFVRDHGLGVVTGADGGYLIATDPDTVRSPDVGFVQAERAPGGRLPDGFVRGAPDLAAEVVSPNDRIREIDEKVEEYLGTGSRLVWIIHPRRRTVTVYAPDRPPRLLTEHDTLDGEAVVPGFRYALTALW